MITSSIDSKVEYNVTNSIDKMDLDREAFVYKAKIYNKHIKFVLGTPKYDYLSNNILYFNIYLANNGSVVSKIGIYETNNTDYVSLLDGNGDVDLNKMAEPIIFAFAKPLIMNNYKLIDKFETMSNASSDNEDTDNEDTYNEDSNNEDSNNEDSDNESSKSAISKNTSMNYDLLALASQTKEESAHEISHYE